MEKNPKFHYFRQSESILFFADVLNICTKSEFSEPRLAESISNLQQISNTLSGDFKAAIGSAITEVLVALDESRDNDYKFIRRIASAYLQHFNKEKAEAGEKILRVINKYGKGADRFNYVSETTTLRNLGNELTTDEGLVAATNLIKVKEVVNHMIENNDAFHQQYLNRIEEEAESEDVKAAQLIKEAIAVYQNLTNRLDAILLLEPTEALLQMQKQLISLVNQYNDVVTNR